MVTRRYVSTGRNQIHLWDSGAGPPLVLLGPAPRSARVYRRLITHLTGFRCLALDTRGFGESAAAESPLHMSDYAQDVVHVLDILELDKAHIFGLHTGNKIAAAFAAFHPDRADRVVLAGRTHSIIADQEARNAAVRASMTSNSASRTAPDSRSQLLERLQRQVGEIERLWAGRGRVDAKHLEEELLALRDEAIDELAAWDGVDPVYAANFEFDLALTLERVRAPTLIIELVTAETAVHGHQAPLLKARMADCTALAIEAHEQTLLREHPERLAAPVIAFLQGGLPTDVQTHS